MDRRILIRRLLFTVSVHRVGTKMNRRSEHRGDAALRSHMERLHLSVLKIRIGVPLHEVVKLTSAWIVAIVYRGVDDSVLSDHTESGVRRRSERLTLWIDTELLTQVVV